MSQSPRTYSFESEFDAPVSEVWRVISDTDLIDGAIGLPAITYRDEPQPDGTTRRFGSLRKMGIPIEYEEMPFTWVHEQMFDVLRVFSKGPFRTFRHTCELFPRDPDAPQRGCRVKTTFTVETGGMFGGMAQRGTRKGIMAPYEKIYAEANEQLRKRTRKQQHNSIILQRPLPMDELDTRGREAESARVAELVTRARRVFDSPLVDKIGDAITRYPDEELRRMQPKAFASRWKAARPDTLNAFLAATRAGLLNMRWDVICPHCRGDKLNLASLADVRERAFCPGCNIDFDVDLDRSLEAVFTPHPQVRTINDSHYCLGGPGTTPHVVYQKQLEPGEEHAFELRLGEGRYRARFSGSKRYRWIEVSAGGAKKARIEAADADVEGDDLAVSSRGAVAFKVANTSKRRVLALIESVEWARDALSAGELVADQRFRDLFSNEALAPGIKLAVGSATILFTALVGSTALYNDLGDARAFSLVRTHFEIMHELVTRHQGAIVKTIGDAILAVFVRAEDALRAASDLHEQVDGYVRQKGRGRGAKLKIGLHEGPCIAVTLNDKLDYFGTTVNLAARVQHLSEGGDILVTQALADSARGCEALTRQGWRGEPKSAQAKGFDRPVPVLRFTRPD